MDNSNTPDSSSDSSSKESHSDDTSSSNTADESWDKSTTPVLLTEKAIEMVRLAIEEEGKTSTHGLRVAVQGGGCSGLQYSLDFSDKARPGDYTYEIDGLKIYIDLASRKYLEGTKVDYLTGLQGSGFKFDNPNAERSCGCGHSFS